MSQTLKVAKSQNYVRALNIKPENFSFVDKEKNTFVKINKSISRKVLPAISYTHTDELRKLYRALKDDRKLIIQVS